MPTARAKTGFVSVRQSNADPRGRFLVLVILLMVWGVTQAAAASSNASEKPRYLKKSSPDTWISVGGYLGQGDYGRDSDTDINAFLIKLRHKWDAWQFSITGSYLNIDSTGQRFIGFLNEDEFDPEDEFFELEPEFERIKRQRSGVGDTNITVIKRLTKKSMKKRKLSFGVRLKLPTADESEGLGTGERDVTTYVSMLSRHQRWVVHGQLGMQWMGDTATTDYNNRPFIKLGLQRLLNKRFSLGTQYYLKRPSRDGRESIRSISGFLQSRLARDLTVSLVVAKGLSNATTDTSFTGILSKGF